MGRTDEDTILGAVHLGALIDYVKSGDSWHTTKLWLSASALLNGNMCCGVVGEDLCVRLGNDSAAEALKERHTSKMDFTGKPLKSMVYVRPAGIKTDDDLKDWVKRAVTFTKSLPPK